MTFTYEGGQRALDGIDITVEHGEFVAVMGPNGAGKTTLCLLLNGVIPNVIGGSLAGRIEVDGLATTEHHVYELASRVGVVLQDPDAQILASDVLSEVAFAAENLGLPRELMTDRIGRALATVRLQGLEDRAPEELSGGQKQRLAIAAGLVIEPSIFVLDEPTAQLDPVGRLEVFQVLQELNRARRITVIVATHDSEAVARVATRVIVLDSGRIVADGPPVEVFAQVELLDQVGIAVPEVVRVQEGLRHVLGEGPPALGVAETADRLRGLLVGHRLEVRSARSRGEIIESSRSRELGPPIIELRDVSFSYSQGAQPVLRGVDLIVYRGEFLAIAGQNGSGKTTLVKCLAGLLRPQRGELRVNGELVDDAVARQLPRRVGVVLQNPDDQLFRMSVLEEIRFGLDNIQLPPEERERRAMAALELTGLAPAARTYPFKLSFGDRRKVAVAAIIAMEPPILVFDEPTTGQDLRGRLQLCEIARRLNEQGTTVIMITHDMDLIARYAERMVVMAGGRVIFDGPIREGFSQPETLRVAFLAPPEVTQLAQALGDTGVPRDLLSIEEFLWVVAPTGATAGKEEG